MKTGKTLVEFAKEVERQAREKQDFLAPVTMLDVASTVIEGGKVSASDIRVGDTGSYDMLPLAHRQLGEYVGIPATFYDFLRTSGAVDPFNTAVPLFDAVVNGLLKQKPADDRRLIRTLDGKMRSMLSDRYRVLDNDAIFPRMMSVLQDVPGLDLANSSMEITDNRLYMQIVDSNKPAPAPGTHDKMDVLFRGAIISNSETGQGSFSIRPLIFHQVCSNGMIITKEAKRKYHTGSSGFGDQGDVWEYAEDDTIKARNEATVLEMRDALRRALSDDLFAKITDDIAAVNGIPVAPKAVEGVIENVTGRFRLSQPERDNVFGNFIGSGNLSVWGIIEAMTKAAQSEEVSYDRSVEMQMQAGMILSLPKHEVMALAEGAKLN